MTEAEIISSIQASSELKALIPDAAAIAAALSVGRVKYVPTEVGNGGILQAMGITEGNQILDYIYNNNDLRHVKPLVEQGRLRLDAVMTRTFLESFVTGGLCSRASADNLLALAQVPDPVTEDAVKRALWEDNGTLRVVI